MAGGKLPPRQKMIGMMYLVLTALLAMNVSKDILNAFVIVNEGLQKTNNNFSDKNALSYNAFSKLADKEVKAKPFYARSLDAKKEADDLIKYIDDLKKELIIQTDKKTKEAADTLMSKMQYVDAKDNYDVPTEIMIGSEPSSPKSGSFTALELKSKIDGLKSKLLKLLDDDASKGIKFLKQDVDPVKGSINSGLNTNVSRVENGTKEDWAQMNFYHLPLAAVITNLTKMQSDVKNAEAEIVNTLIKSVGANEVRFDKLQAKVIAPSSYIISGNKYVAEVLLVASSSTSNYKISLTGGSQLPMNGGVGTYETVGSGVGVKSWGGIIEVPKPDGSVEKFDFNAEYIVAQPSVSVSPDKMNVFYIGVDNPVTVSAAGIPASDMIVSFNGSGSISLDKAGKGVVRVSGGTEASVNVSARIAGTTKSLGSMKFRVKPLPNPVGTLAGQKGDVSMKKSLILASGQVLAKMENFDFDLKVSVQSCVLTANVAGDLREINCPGGSLGPALSMIQGLKGNSKLYVEQVKARLPDGTVRNISGLNIRVQL